MDRQVVEVLIRIEKRLERIERILSSSPGRTNPRPTKAKKKITVPKHL
jgi:hypothetical protein